MLAAYISAETKQHGAVRPQVDNNWRLATFSSPQPLDIRFETSPSEKATAFIKAHAQYPMKSEGTDNIGFAVYKIDLISK
ncbi:2',3'-cyclic-nucleotide 2'-phosphodiesterase/3'-nucleotidase precursor [compost metagenome]